MKFNNLKDIDKFLNENKMIGISFKKKLNEASFRKKLERLYSKDTIRVETEGFSDEDLLNIFKYYRDLIIGTDESMSILQLSKDLKQRLKLQQDLLDIGDVIRLFKSRFYDIVKVIEEMNVTGNIAGYEIPGAFSRGSEDSENWRRRKGVEQLGYKLAPKSNKWFKKQNKNTGKIIENKNLYRTMVKYFK